jgi:hypothetical protein
MSFDVETAQRVIAEVGKLTTDLASIDEKRKNVRSQLKAKKAELAGLLKSPRRKANGK